MMEFDKEKELNIDHGLGKIDMIELLYAQGLAKYFLKVQIHTKLKIYIGEG